jgi:hypothetical protein
MAFFEKSRKTSLFPFDLVYTLADFSKFVQQNENHVIKLLSAKF